MPTLANVIMNSIAPLAQAEASALAISGFIGSKPTVVNHGDYVEVVFTPEQETAAADFIMRQINKDPGNVRFTVGNIFLQVLFRKYWLYLVGLFGGGVVLGRVTGRRRK